MTARLRFSMLAPRFLAVYLLAACAPLIGPYNEQAYLNATSLKAQSLALVAKSGDDFGAHRDAAEALLVEVDAAYQYSRGLPGNEIAAQQWAILRDPNGNLLGGFFRKWQTDGRTAAFYRSEKGIQIAEAFDLIICLEVNKQRARACAPAPG